MPHNNAHPDHLGWKAYTELLGLVGTVFVVAAVLAAVGSAYFYCSQISVIEQISHRSLSPGWTCLLLFVPIAIQLMVFLRLRKRIRQAVSDNKLRAYLKFYFGRMAFSLLVYTVLWLCYVVAFALGLSSRVIWFISWLPLIGVLALMAIVIHATYLITRTSFRDDEMLLTEDEVGSNYDLICTTLSEANTSEVEKIRQWLRRDRDYKVHRAALRREVTDLDIAHLTEALNRLIRNRHFYEDIPSGSQGHHASNIIPLPKDIETANRRYLNQYLLRVSSGESTAANSEQDRKGRAEQERLAKQKGQKDGIVMFPFYTMVFFFSVFLCVAYLFGFAFAFDDRYVQLTDPKKQVSLFMTDDLLEDAEHQTGSALFRTSNFINPAVLAGKLRDVGDPLSKYIRAQFTDVTQNLLKEYDGADPIPEPLQSALVDEFNKLLKGKAIYEPQRFASVRLREETKRLLTQQSLGDEEMIRLNRMLIEDAYPSQIARSQQTGHASSKSVGYKPSKLRKMFYFNSGGAGIRITAAGRATGKDKYIAQNNSVSLDTLVSQIKDALDNGDIVRVELVGRADDNKVSKGVNPAGNATNKDSYSSNYEVAAARVRSVRYVLEQKLIERKMAPSRLEEIDWVELHFSNDPSLAPRQRNEDGTDSRIEASNAHLVINAGSEQDNTPAQKVAGDLLRDLKAKTSVARAKKSWRGEIQEYWRRLGSLAQAGKLTEMKMQDLYNDIEDWNELKSEGQEDSAAEKQDQIERELFHLEDLAGSMRSVEVLLYEAIPPGQSPYPHLKRMALMDYLYFAMYTITTTGYGDIKPTTPYAKFLCTLANMAEIFFIVVFFNTLLSLRQEKLEAA